MIQSQHDHARRARGLLTLDVLDDMITGSLGQVPLLCIVGPTRSGKTWAATEWAAARSGGLVPAAYADCRDLVEQGVGSLHWSTTVKKLWASRYPRFALDGIDIVIVDEPLRNVGFVHLTFARTGVKAGLSAHQLVVLLLQDLRHLPHLGLPVSRCRFCDTAGRPLALPG